MTDSPELRAARWAASSDTGVSSLAILGVMTGAPPRGRFCYPHDSGDLGRCLGLLKAVPEYRSRLDEMRAVGPEWSALVDHWPELERMHASDSLRKVLYERMKEILDPIEKANRSLIKLGPNASVHFGP